MVANATNVVGGKLKESVPAELNEAIERVGALISDRRRGSVTFRLRGKLGTYDFGSPLIGWSMTRRLPVNPASRYLKTLVFYAVCRENGRASKFLFTVNKAVFGGFFLADEAEYLHWVARRNGFELDFRGAYRKDRGPPPDDLRSINQRRRVTAALEAGRPGEALRLVTRFAHLCKAG
ncbi:MAG: hypothetical protein ACR2OV_16565 [Hyphomicrobiaceae bacterium]